VASVAWLKVTAVPRIDREASARGLYRGAAGKPVCLGEMPRAWPYGVNYYFDRVVPVCGPGDARLTLRKPQ